MISDIIISLAAAATPVASTALPQTQTVQQAFDAAAALAAAEDQVGALKAYKALEARLVASGKNLSSLALVRLRIGMNHTALRQFDDAITPLRTGLDGLPADNANFDEDRLAARMQLAQLLEYQLDLEGSANLYRAMAAGKLDGPDTVRAYAGIARAVMFSDGESALKAINIALAAASVEDKATTASLLTLRGRILMNLRRFPESRTDLFKAMTLLGGLTRSVDFRDLHARSDLAIVSMLMNRQDEAREYLAFTGAGRFDAPLIAAAGDPPTCGGTPNISPDDMAIVDFTIDANGTVGTATTVYASNPATALSFADAVRSWSWSPENLAKIPALFRSTTRIELRCTRSIGGFGIEKLLEPASNAWAQKNGLKSLSVSGRSYAAWIGGARAELITRRAQYGADSIQLIPVLTAIMSNPLSTSLETTDAANTLRTIADKNPLSPPMQAMIAYARLERGFKATSYAAANQERSNIVRAALADPATAKDAVAGPALLLAQSDLARRMKDDVGARRSLQQIVEFPGLTDNDPAKIAALVRIASIDARSGNLASAQQAFLKSGLSESQCALVDATPVQTGGSGNDSDFPNEAIRWGFSGFAVSEYDIDATGKAEGMRTTIAYPPLIFGQAANKIASRFRFTQSFRPGGSQGCTARTQRVAFRNRN